MRCSKCGLKAVIRDGKVIIPCRCNAPIIADIKAVASGAGGFVKK